MTRQHGGGGSASYMMPREQRVPLNGGAPARQDNDSLFLTAAGSTGQNPTSVLWELGDKKRGETEGGRVRKPC